MVTNMNSWMSGLDNSLTLDQISIPGTHDSGTAGVSEIVKGTALTQNFGIDRQLEDGVRFIDIRLHFNGKDLDIYHGIIDCGLTFDSVLTQCQSFLANHRTEVIIMLANAAQADQQSLIEPAFQPYLARFPELLCLDAKPGALGSLRGKVVLFRRFFSQNRDPMGVDLQDGWPDDSTGQFVNRSGLSFDIEDWYTCHDTKKKWDAVKSSLDRASHAASDGVTHITYNSICASVAHSPYQYAWGGGITKVDPIMNESLKADVGARQSKSRLGVVALDFYNNHGDDNTIVTDIVQSNF